MLKLLLLALLTSATNSCTNDADCSYNGACTTSTSTCECTTPWSGTSCSQLTLGIVNKSEYGYREGFPYTTSWGGSVQYDPDSEQYIMLVSEYAAQCPNWGHNSAVSLATSTTPQGPYTKQYRLFGVMSHEAMLSRGNAGEWVVYFTAKTVAGTGLPATGVDDDNIHGTLCTRTDTQSKCECPDGNPGAGSSDPTWMSWTNTPLVYDSWSTPVLIMDPQDSFSDVFCVDGSSSCNDCDEPATSIDANWNGVIHADGSYVGLWRTWQCSEDVCPENGYPLLSKATDLEGGQACYSVPHYATASDWKDPTSYRVSNGANSSSSGAFPVEKKKLTNLFASQYNSKQAAKGIEDPMIYQDANGIYHAIYHDMFEKCSKAIDFEGPNCKAPRDNVSHGYSINGIDWTYTGAALSLVNQGEHYMPEVTFTDGTKTGLSCERPQLIVEKGVPSHIIIGGIPKGLGSELGNGNGNGNTGEEDVFENLDLYDWPGGATMVIPLVSGPTPPAQKTLHIAKLTIAIKKSGSKWQPTLKFVLKDSTGTPVKKVKLAVAYQKGNSPQTIKKRTSNSKGKANIKLPKINNSQSYSAQVTSMVLNGYVYDAEGNVPYKSSCPVFSSACPILTIDD